MIHTLRIASRDSTLAVRQTEIVKEKLQSIGIESELVLIKSKGDLSLSNPIHDIGAIGIFTKAIDDAVLDERADIGVHSLKDLPSIINDNLDFSCVLEREDPHDVVVFKENDFMQDRHYQATIATGSVRRKAQWLNKFPNHTVVPLRGNVDSRLKKLIENQWDGIILAAAGLKRLKANVAFKKLDWMIPAPGQGAIAIVSRERDNEINKLLDSINHKKTFNEITAEREFMKNIKAGCSSAVGALACAEGEQLHLIVEVLSLDGKSKILVELSDDLGKASELGKRAAIAALESGAQKLLNPTNERS